MDDKHKPAQPAETPTEQMDCELLSLWQDEGGEG